LLTLITCKFGYVDKRIVVISKLTIDLWHNVSYNLIGGIIWLNKLLLIYLKKRKIK
jgi:hypothetical protein